RRSEKQHWENGSMPMNQAVRSEAGPVRQGRFSFGNPPRGSVTVVDSIEDIERYSEAIEDLAENAAHPNPFYEPWCLLPLLEASDRKRKLRLLLVHGTNDNGSGAHDALIGFFPFEQKLLHPL